MSNSITPSVGDLQRLLSTAIIFTHRNKSSFISKVSVDDLLLAGRILIIINLLEIKQKRFFLHENIGHSINTFLFANPFIIFRGDISPI
jgi:hypothetical protein